MGNVLCNSLWDGNPWYELNVGLVDLGWQAIRDEEEVLDLYHDAITNGVPVCAEETFRESIRSGSFVRVN